MKLLHYLGMTLLGKRIEGYRYDAENAAEEWDEGSEAMDSLQYH
jgi:hypothetical protein